MNVFYHSTRTRVSLLNPPSTCLVLPTLPRGQDHKEGRLQLFLAILPSLNIESSEPASQKQEIKTPQGPLVFTAGQSVL